MSSEPVDETNAGCQFSLIVFFLMIAVVAAALGILRKTLPRLDDFGEGLLIIVIIAPSSLLGLPLHYLIRREATATTDNAIRRVDIVSLAILIILIRPLPSILELDGYGRAAGAMSAFWLVAGMWWFILSRAMSKAKINDMGRRIVCHLGLIPCGFLAPILISGGLLQYRGPNLTWILFGLILYQFSYLIVMWITARGTAKDDR